jgi:predicted nucleotidyltransferase
MSMKKHIHITIPKEQIAEFCQQHHISKLALFGSELRNDFGPESDIDLLVEFEQGYTPGLFGIARMERELSVILGGRKVDLRTPEDLSRYFRDEVLHDAEVQYVQG